MSPRDHLEITGPDDHAQVSLLLPWYVNESLDPPESSRVEAHVAICDLCRGELVELRDLESVVQDQGDAWQPSSGQLERLKKRVGAQDRVLPGAVAAERPPLGPTSWGASIGTSIGDWLRETAAPTRWLVFGQAAAVAGLAGLVIAQQPVLPRDGGAQFETRSSVGSVVRVPADLQIVFAGEATETELRALLQEIEGSIVSGPSARGVYQVALAQDAPRDAALAILRAHARVVFAEPLGRGAP